MSSVISRIAWRWSPVSSNGRCCFELGRERLLQGEADPGARPFSERPGTRLHQLLVEQFVERQPAPARFRLGQRGRPVHRASAVPSSWSPTAARRLLGWGSVTRASNVSKVLMDQAADLRCVSPSVAGYTGSTSRARGFPLVRENHKLARHELAAVVVAHRPRHEQQLAFFDLSLEKRLTWPGTLERTTAASSRSTARNTRRPLRVGSTPVLTTRPTQVTSWPTCTLAIGVTVVASR